MLFVLAALLFTWWIAAPTFTDPDSFYHLKIADMMIKNRAAITEFPWLQFTTLTDTYSDHHLLYHIFLIPFILLFNKIVGMKVATVVLAAATVAFFYFMLRRLQVRYAFLFSLLLLFTSGFAFRMALSKAPSVGFLFLMGGFFLILTNKRKLLAILSFFYVWAYGGFLLLPVVAFVHNAVGVGRWAWQHKAVPSPRQLITHFADTLITVAGIAAGLLIHPSFPKHFQFYWQQVIQIGLVNYQDIVSVGGEWYPTSLQDLLTSPLLLTSLVIIAGVAWVATAKKQTQASTTTLIMTLIFFLFTLKSQRYIEYYIPWGYLFAALSLTASGLLTKFKSVKEAVQQGWKGDALQRTVTILVAAYVLIMIPGIMLTDAKRLSNQLHNGIPVDRFAKVGTWLREHSTKGDIIFHNDWDDFPALFYNVARDRFIVGLDPTFMYNKNPELYKTWAAITRGEKADNLLEVIQGDFRARFVLIDHEHDAMRNNIIADGRFKQVYEDHEVTVFRVPRKAQSATTTPQQTPLP